MMGYDDDNDGLVENEDEMEAELAAILGGGSQLKKQAKKKPTKCEKNQYIHMQKTRE